LNATSVFIWSLLGCKSDFDLLAQTIAAHYGIDLGRASGALNDFVDQMGALGFVEVDDASEASQLRKRYLDLLNSALVNTLYAEHELRIEWLERHGAGTDIASARRLRDIRYADRKDFAELLACKADGRNWKGRVTRFSHTMVGMRRLQNLEWCATRVFSDGVAGDFMEAGVCQGGASIFMRALQVAHGEDHRQMWVADSFQGLPEPNSEFDRGYEFQEARQPWLAATLEAVQDNFSTYGLLSERVHFLPGWFADTLKGAPVEALAVLRIDADLYASTRDVLLAAYDKLAPGGFIIVDDYYAFPPCRRAVDEFRDQRKITEPLIRIDWTAVFWRKR
jgi:O-methyltransferase